MAKSKSSISKNSPKIATKKTTSEAKKIIGSSLEAFIKIKLKTI